MLLLGLPGSSPLKHLEPYIRRKFLCPNSGAVMTLVARSVPPRSVSGVSGQNIYKALFIFTVVQTNSIQSRD